MSDLIVKRRIRLCQLSGTDLAEIIVPYTNAEIMSLWIISEDWQRVLSNYLEILTTNILKESTFSLWKEKKKKNLIGFSHVL